MNMVQELLNHVRAGGTFLVVSIDRRAAIHAALGDPIRLAIVDELYRSDRSPGELRALLGVSGPLLTFHLDSLEAAGLVRRSTSAGDQRRRYVQLVSEPLELVRSPPTAPDRPVLFVCTHNSARSQLAAAVWVSEAGTTATSAGTHPSPTIHPGARSAADRADLRLGATEPRHLPPSLAGSHVVTVCDRAREELDRIGWHWSIPDPAIEGSDAAFDAVVAMLRDRVRRIVAVSEPPHRPGLLATSHRHPTSEGT